MTDNKHTNTPASKGKKWFGFFVRMENTPENRAIYAKTKAYAALNGCSISEWYIDAMKAYHIEQRKNPNFRSVVEDGE